MTDFDSAAPLEWLPASTPLLLDDHEVHLWRANLDATTDYLKLAQTLSDDEQRRAERFRFEHLQRHFVVGRGGLRSLLGAYLNLPPETLEFCYGTHGKPALTPACNPINLQFNVSHSQGLALYAVTRDRPVGVDLEYIRAIDHLDQLTQRFFSAQEHASIGTLPPDQQQTAFFRHWVCKEAYLKATGTGLGQLSHIEISFASGKAVLRDETMPRTASRWSILEFMLTDEYTAALAVNGTHWRLRCWQFS
ncbi:4'-phosphopantetheinyl transferase superfamily protein [Oculatella sp. LEGE 06141]|uniref:4'-phosphopantetheinyl transferase family protein n=1 Tax=Oculatella sp. LEGE 06141 TaxID=1828648 RepID=UPI0018816562|nr:4'-phosphopantetheinyl transferase superfamily protein [Oculatella sp. LEGE 06141]MBE9178852.1 4'-phosphopantetheinyl transferase superfamily protein [Oculatella sp. LEGE 06141]